MPSDYAAQVIAQRAVEKAEKEAARRERKKQTTLEWRLRNPERVKEATYKRVRKWKKAHPEKNSKYNYICCKNYYHRNYNRYFKPRNRNGNLMKNYRITAKQWEAMFLRQGEVCACCRGTQPGSKKGWHTDHCHITGVIRGILCHHCNVMIGMAKDNCDTLRAAVKYLEEAGANSVPSLVGVAEGRAGYFVSDAKEPKSALDSLTEPALSDESFIRAFVTTDTQAVGARELSRLAVGHAVNPLSSNPLSGQSNKPGKRRNHTSCNDQPSIHERTP